jgi:hypothetical protein
MENQANKDWQGTALEKLLKIVVVPFIVFPCMFPVETFGVI